MNLSGKKELKIDSSLLSPMKWRCIGPFRGGRVVAVAGDPKDSLVFYFGATAGGVWKTYDAGTYWENISDGFFNVAAVGAIAISESDSNVVYVGTGEGCIRHDASHGDGVYKSTDGGKTWVNIGLHDTRHITRIRVHPRNPDLVYVAAFGHMYGPNKERGVFRSSNGGKSWERILYKSDKSGAVDLTMDSNNPRILFAALNQAIRTPWNISSGGADSGLFRSTDGGDTWVDISNYPGLPTGIKGRIGVAISPAREGRVWALIEAEDGALFRSEDYGETWTRLSDRHDLRRRGWYYNHFYADPSDADTCYVITREAFKSIDGGMTFQDFPMPHGDHHDLWIDPNNPERMIEGSDGGATVTLNGGSTWSTLYNQPCASLFHLDTDSRFPYHVYGTQQDNTAICVPSRSDEGAIPSKDCYSVGSAESGYIAVNPENFNIVYAGAIGSSPGGGGVMLRHDSRTKESRIITVWPENQGGAPIKDLKHRFFFTYPIVISPHDSKILYCAGERVFRSKDEGSSWEAISPDLTRNDVSKMQEQSGGPITKEDGGASDYYCTIFTFVESMHTKGVFWAGSDDGLVHLSLDNGQTWENVTPANMPEWALISSVSVSPHNDATAYIAATLYQFDDMRPILFKTHDYGKTWIDISRGIPEGDFTRVIREDPDRPGLLYVGTETGIYVSFDDGVNWLSLQLNLPKVPVYDMAFKGGDLIVATHGRSFWILDDLSVLHQIDEQTINLDVHLFEPRRINYRLLASARMPRRALPGKNYHRVSGEAVAYYQRKDSSGATENVYLDAGENPPGGVAVTYYLNEIPKGDVLLTFLDQNGEIIDTFSSNVENHKLIAPRVGMNRFVWDMYYPGELRYGRNSGIPMGARPVAPPGSYQVAITVSGIKHLRTFEILKDPRVEATDADLKLQFDLHLKIRDKLSAVNKALEKLRNTRRQIFDWVELANGTDVYESVAQLANAIESTFESIESEMTRDHCPDQLALPPVGINDKLASLTQVVSSSHNGPTTQSFEVFSGISAKADDLINKLENVVAFELPAFNKLVSGIGLRSK